MGRTMLGRARWGVAGVVCVLAVATSPRRSGLSARRARRSPTTRRSGRPPTAAAISRRCWPTCRSSREWVDATHYLETRREADGRRRVYVTSAPDGTSRLVGPADPTAVTAPGAAFRVVLRDHDLVRIDADGTERRLTANPPTRITSASRRTAPASPTSAATTCSPTTSPPASSASSPPTAARRS